MALTSIAADVKFPILSAVVENAPTIPGPENATSAFGAAVPVIVKLEASLALMKLSPAT